ncbi:energy-coupling factor transporter ATPase [Periweissella ghanensis]|uniref:Energy-coupling factor transporter ATP-binding protein EcfA2 n=1 Tax=Periweissella ghanensis TaxID=467997 RepID=A0ABN8BNU4_9LACO|nr:energy-coupling factor transporter ATPase [Periweissella ghanensis]MCM0600538.1 energy-coupling factor transporter ATPase [Periweissella ghanensis]CAH0418252.1 Energy-coupling factor transporter ATP-binding protein EcfA2 [Periweissella ghanensis]
MAIEFKNVNYTYQVGTPFANNALTDLNFTIKPQSYTALIGHTGSGKSTILQLLDGLIKPTTGQIIFDEHVIDNKTSQKVLAKVRQHVGIVFQFPESQLFEQTVLKDVMFGPQNFGKTAQEAQALAEKALRLVNLPEEHWQKSPFDLSGGQMRRVAIAGVLAIEPSILILDEPTAGLDPVGRKEMMQMFAQLQQQQNLTIILVTHQMEDVAEYADDVLVMVGGKLVKHATPSAIFADIAWLQAQQLDVPHAVLFKNKLQAQGLELPTSIINVEQLAQSLQQYLQKGDQG